MPDEISISEGRRLFGLDPEAYDATRPSYPTWMFDELRDVGALAPGRPTLEIGPGSGLATRSLIEYGAGPLVLVEPDDRFVGMLKSATAALPNCRILQTSFEEADLGSGEFDLAVAATMFHWLDPETRVRKLRSVVRSGGTVALLWNVLSVQDKADPFHEATQALLSTLAVSPSGEPDALPFALDRQSRESEARLGGFKEVSYLESRWLFQLASQQIAKLYAGFSHIQRLDGDSRDRILKALVQIADEQFDGIVERNVTSCLYRLS